VIGTRDTRRRGTEAIDASIERYRVHAKLILITIF
jgi:hypothetical protein